MFAPIGRAAVAEVENRTAGSALAVACVRPPEAMFCETPRFTLAVGAAAAATGDPLDPPCCESAKAILSESVSLVPLVGRIGAPPRTLDDIGARGFKDACLV